MTPTEGRIWITKASLVAYGATFAFFALAPALRYPLTYSDALDILKIIAPIFSSYLGAAVLFVVTGEDSESESDSQPNKMLALVVRWPVAIFGVVLIALLIAFPLSNKWEFTGTGMTPKTLSLFVSLLTAFLAATTGAISSFLFRSEKHSKRRITERRSTSILNPLESSQDSHKQTK
jgi:hypothetical protein